MVLFRFARPRRPSCLAPVFLVPSDLKAGRREGVLRQQEAAQVWDPAFPGHVGSVDSSSQKPLPASGVGTAFS